MALFSKASKRKIRKATPKLVMALGVVAVCFVATILIGQANREKEIASEMQALAAEYQLLSNEKQRLENMVEYVHSDEYLLQYAREKLGFVGEGDIKFDIGE